MLEGERQKYVFYRMPKKKGKKQQERIIPSDLILCLETSTDVSSVALFAGAELLAIQDYHANKLHAKTDHADDTADVI